MFGDYLNSRFEIEITHRHGRTEAYCKIFPECFGVGQNEEEAIEDLADSISLYLSETLKDAVGDMLKTSPLRRVRPVKEIKKLDAEKKNTAASNKKEEKDKYLFAPKFRSELPILDKLFKDYGKKPLAKGGILSILGLKPLSPVAFHKKGQEQQLFQGQDDFLDLFDQGIGFIEQIGLPGSREPEGIMLGIPLSFN